MAYPESCFSKLLGIKGICEPPAVSPMFWLNDVPGIDVNRLAQLATTENRTGQQLGVDLIDTASRIMATDVEAIYDSQFKVQNTLVTGCSICTFLSNFAAGNQRGVMVKNNVTSSMSTLVMDKLQVKTNQTGTFTILIDDGDASNLREIIRDFEAGVVYEFTEVGYQTKRDRFRIYMMENVSLPQLSCPKVGSGCGCGGAVTHVVNDLVYTGTLNGVEAAQAYGFIPCCYIRCDAADLLCFVAGSAPRMIGLALLYKTAELYFTEKYQSVRNNRVAGNNVDDAKEDVKKFAKLYTDKLNGTGSRGVKDLVFTTLSQTYDVCVVCNSLNSTAWAAG